LPFYISVYTTLNELLAVLHAKAATAFSAS